MAQFQISNKDMAEIQAAKVAAQEQHELLEKAITGFNEILNTAREATTKVMQDYTAARNTLSSLIETQYELFTGQFDEKSESWQEGERGEQATEFLEALESVYGHLDEELGIDLPGDIADFYGDSPEALIDDMPTGAE